MLQAWLSRGKTLAASAGVIIAAVVITIYCASATTKKSVDGPIKRKPPYLPSTLPLLGNTLELISNAPRFHDWVAEKLVPREGHPILLKLPGKPDMMITARPEHFEEILKTQLDNFPKSKATHDELFDLMGDNIINTNGDTWKRQREVFLTLLNARALREHMMPLSQKYAAELCGVLADAAASDTTVDFFQLSRRYTLDVLAEIGFGTSMGLLRASIDHVDPLEEALEVAQFWSSNRIKLPMLWWKLKRWLNVGSERELRYAVQVIDDHVMDIVSAAFERNRVAKEDTGDEIAGSQSKRDIISIILNRIQTDADPMGPSMVRDIAVGAVLAGRDTTADALSWLFHVLAQNPRVETKLRAELLANIPMLATEDCYIPSAEDVSVVTYVEATIRELLRLYPAGPVIGAQSIRDTVFPDGTFVPKNTRVAMAFYSTGRLKSVWGPDADVFMPERFLDPETRKLLSMSSTKFCAFSSGPRNCVGRNLAMVEMKIVVASIVTRFHFVPDPQQKEVVSSEGITLGMKHPLLMRVERIAVASVGAMA